MNYEISFQQVVTKKVDLNLANWRVIHSHFHNCNVLIHTPCDRMALRKDVGFFNKESVIKCGGCKAEPPEEIMLACELGNAKFDYPWGWKTYDFYYYGV